MIEFLKEYGISDNTVDELNNTLFDSMLFNIDNNELEIKKIINYFNEIGIKCIDELLLYDIELFLLPFSQVKDKFEKHDVAKLVEMINNDYEMISQI